MIKTAKALAANTDLVTAQSFLFSEETTYLAILISGSGDDVFTKVRQIGVGVKDNFFDSTESLPTRLKELLTNIQKELEGVEELNLILAAWKDNPSQDSQTDTSTILYLQPLGQHKAYLLRKDKTLPLINSTQSGSLISGYFKLEDRLILLSQSLSDHFGERGEELLAFLKTPNDLIQEEVDELIHNHPELDPVAVIIIDYYPSEPLAAPHSGASTANVATSDDISPSDPPSPRFKFKFHLPDNLTSYLPQTRKKQLILAGVLLLALLVVIGMTFKNKGQDLKKVQFTALMVDAQKQLSQAQSLRDLDQAGAKSALDQSKQDLSQAKVLLPKDPVLVTLQKQIETSQNDILKIYPVNALPLFLDLRLIKPNFFTKQLGYYNGQLLLLDDSQKSVVLVDIAKKSNQPLAGTEQLGQPKLVSLNGTFGFVFSPDKGIIKIDTNTIKPQLIVKTDPEWGEIASIEGFASNVYLLDSLKNQIWKYVPTVTSYSDRQSYLESGTVADFAGAKKMLIDGSVWVLKPQSVIEKYTQGALDNFSLSGLDQPVKDLTSFFVSDETDNVYLLDSGNSRIITVTKTGQYVSQMVSDKFKSILDLAVDEKNKQLYLLDGSSIYQVGLK